MLEEDSIDALRTRARRRLPKAVFDFIDGGARQEITLRRNEEDLRQMALVPNCLVDVSQRNLQVPVLGRPANLPLIVAPTGLASLVWPRADLHLARAAADAGIPFVISTSSSERLEDIAGAAPHGRNWFQIYPYRDQALVESLIRRASAAGIEALVLTVDAPLLGHRSRDHRNRFAVPLRITPRLAWDCIRCPAWTWGILKYGIPRMKNFVDYGHGTTLQSLAQLMTANLNAGATWADLRWIRQEWSGKLIIKGIMSAASAEQAANAGIDAIVISNHGGRQLDGAASSISRVPEIVRSLAGRVEIYVDGGIRQGGDIAKALCLGATAVLVGRATLYGVAAAGRTGTDHAIDTLRRQFDETLTLLGCASPRHLDSTMIRTHPWAQAC
ncbi:MAG TPA: alpha-hydroxy acid oxidase [Steroidobacteraceae bacterium]|jgi:(S)-mandelate dehydrogenase|nr:alpha-hydroxy acid oxidase [Steroidobacteraceae bacterium]